ncbi:hypothetical protein [Frigidibacter oleivorans]|uniref:hypothetical protein n=1 Tax=Frigidibacter oleivorans TaxID=2487129 RepID=UPI000F8D8DE7|nr:hypothetical protein [Frigidibacter oleivorans]
MPIRSTLAIALTGLAAATVLMTDAAESFAPSFTASPRAPLSRPAAQHPTLDNLAVMNLVTAHGASQAYDEPYCDVRVTVTTKLAADFEERRVAPPRLVEDMQVEVWASDRLGTWTMLATRPDGIACVIDTGRNWAGETDPFALARL